MLLLEIFENRDYQIGGHTSPQYGESSSPMYDLGNGVYPMDLYGPKGLSYYGDNTKLESYRKIIKVMGRPNGAVTIFRSIPAEIKGRGKATIHPGDWVSTSRAYAVQHGKNEFGKYKIVTKVVYAYQLFSEGNDLDEWGYDPTAPKPTPEQVDAVRAKYGMKSLAEVKDDRKTKTIKELTHLESSTNLSPQEKERLQQFYDNPVLYKSLMGKYPPIDVVRMRHVISELENAKGDWYSEMTLDSIKADRELYKKIMGKYPDEA